MAPAATISLFRLAAVVVVALVIAGTGAGFGARPATAAFPGSNGKLGFTRLTSSGSNVATKSPTAGNLDIVATGAVMGGWSPNGNRIAYTKSISRTKNQVWTMKADGSDKQQVTSAGRYLSAEYTPDGDILFTEVQDDAEGTARLFTTDPSGGNRREIAPNIAGDMSHGTFAPGGGRVAFVYVRGAKHGIYTVRPNGNDLFKVTGGIFDADPDYSPGGGRIAFSRENSGGTKANIFRVDKDGGNLRNLTNNRDGVFSARPAYSPNGNRIAFDRRIDGSSDFDLYTIRSSDGGDRRGAATSNAGELGASWQPN